MHENVVRDQLRVSRLCARVWHVWQQKNLQALGDLPLLFLQTLRGRGGSSFVVSYQEYSLTHSHEQDFGRTWTSTIRDTGEREWGAHRDTEGGWAGVHPHATELCLFFLFFERDNQSKGLPANGKGATRDDTYARTELLRRHLA